MENKNNQESRDSSKARAAGCLSAVLLCAIGGAALISGYSLGYIDGQTACERRHEKDRVELTFVTKSKPSGTYSDDITVRAVIGEKEVQLESLDKLLNQYGPQKVQETGVKLCGLSRGGQKNLLERVQEGQRRRYGESWDYSSRSSKLSRPVPDFDAEINFNDESSGYGPCFITGIVLTPKK